MYMCFLRMQSLLTPPTLPLRPIRMSQTPPSQEVQTAFDTEEVLLTLRSGIIHNVKLYRYFI